MDPICEKAVSLIKYYESLHDGDLHQVGLQPKPCPAGIWTGGYGRALRHPKTGKFLTLKGGNFDKIEANRQCEGLTETIAEQWLAEDLAVFATGVDAAIKVSVTPEQRGALISFAYNLGCIVLQIRTHRLELPVSVSARWLAELLQCLG